MTKNIRWGILSTGRIVHCFTEGLSRLDDAKLTAVASRSQQKADTPSALRSFTWGSWPFCLDYHRRKLFLTFLNVKCYLG